MASVTLSQRFLQDANTLARNKRNHAKYNRITTPIHEEAGKGDIDVSPQKAFVIRSVRYVSDELYSRFTSVVKQIKYHGPKIFEEEYYTQLRHFLTHVHYNQLMHDSKPGDDYLRHVPVSHTLGRTHFPLIFTPSSQLGWKRGLDAATDSGYLKIKPYDLKNKKSKQFRLTYSFIVQVYAKNPEYPTQKDQEYLAQHADINCLMSRFPPLRKRTRNLITGELETSLSEALDKAIKKGATPGKHDYRNCRTTANRKYKQRVAAVYQKMLPLRINLTRFMDHLNLAYQKATESADFSKLTQETEQADLEKLQIALEKAPKNQKNQIQQQINEKTHRLVRVQRQHIGEVTRYEALRRLLSLILEAGINVVDKIHPTQPNPLSRQANNREELIIEYYPTYRVALVGGRSFEVGGGFQTLPSTIKWDILAHGQNYDLVSSQLTILRGMFHNLNIPCTFLNKYATVQDVADDLGIPKKATKSLLYGLLFSAGKISDSRHSVFGRIYVEFPEQAKAIYRKWRKITKSLRIALKILLATLITAGHWTQHGVTWVNAAGSAITTKRLDYSFCKKLLAHYIQGIETHALLLTLETAKNWASSLEHDGFVGHIETLPDSPLFAENGVLEKGQTPGPALRLPGGKSVPVNGIYEKMLKKYSKEGNFSYTETARLRESVVLFKEFVQETGGSLKHTKGKQLHLNPEMAAFRARINTGNFRLYYEIAHTPNLAHGAVPVETVKKVREVLPVKNVQVAVTRSQIRENIAKIRAKFSNRFKTRAKQIAYACAKLRARRELNKNTLWGASQIRSRYLKGLKSRYLKVMQSFIRAASYVKQSTKTRINSSRFSIWVGASA